MMYRLFPSITGFVFICSLLALAGCEGQPTSSSAGGPRRASLESKVAAARASQTTLVQLGYQRIGTPFLLKSQSESLDRRLQARSARAEWKEFKHGPGVLEAINAKEVDIGYVGETPPVFAQSGGVDFVYAAADPPAPKAEAIVVLKEVLRQQQVIADTFHTLGLIPRAIQTREAFYAPVAYEKAP